MSTTATKSRLHGTVHDGDELPELSVEVTATTIVLGALASRDWRPMHHDKDFAVERNGMKDIFMNAPNQALWFERYVTDWTGPKGRLGRLRFRIRDSVFPGDTMTLGGSVEKVEVDGRDCGWVELELALTVGERVASECTARVALPVRDDDNPWKRHGDDWQP